MGSRRYQLRLYIGLGVHYRTSPVLALVREINGRGREMEQSERVREKERVRARLRENGRKCSIVNVTKDIMNCPPYPQYVL